MELSRLQVYRNRRKKRLILLIKITVATYLLLFSLSYLTGGTVAYFNAKGQQGFKLEAGNWFDGSELVFTGKGNQNIKSCPEVEISVQIKNQRFKMVGPANYEVYYVENGEPRKGGTLESNGVISPLNGGEETTLTFIASKEGFYEFKAYQREGYEGEHSEIWSEKIKVKCNEKNSGNEKENQESEVIKEIQNEVLENENIDSKKEEESTEIESEETDTSQTEENNATQTNETNSIPDEDEQSQDNSAKEETTNVENENTESDLIEEGETNEETN